MDRDSPDSGGNSPSASLPSPPVAPLPPNQRPTNFFIADILRPDFGCAASRERAQEPVRERVRPLARPGLAGTPCTDSCSSDSTSSSSSSPKRSAPAKADDGDANPGVGNASCSAGVPRAPESQPLLWPAWVYCTRYSDRPSSGPRTRKLKKSRSEKEDKRPRTAFTAEQLQRLKTEFQANRYITEQRRQTLAQELSLNESQIKIWFQNKRAKIKKASGFKNGLALQLMAQGLYNHSTTTIQEDKEDSE